MTPTLDDIRRDVAAGRLDADILAARHAVNGFAVLIPLTQLGLRLAGNNPITVPYSHLARIVVTMIDAGLTIQDAASGNDADYDRAAHLMT